MELHLIYEVNGNRFSQAFGVISDKEQIITDNSGVKWSDKPKEGIDYIEYKRIEEYDSN